MYFKDIPQEALLPAKKHVFASPLSLPHDNRIPIHIPWYIFHFHPFAGFCPNSMDSMKHTLLGGSRLTLNADMSGRTV